MVDSGPYGRWHNFAWNRGGHALFHGLHALRRVDGADFLLPPRHKVVELCGPATVDDSDKQRSGWHGLSVGAVWTHV